MGNVNLDKLIRDTLEPLNIPVAKLRYSGKADTYIIFTEDNQAPKVTADDREVITNDSVQVDVFSEGNFIDSVNETRTRLESVGLKRMCESETYDEDMNMYRSIMRFNFENNIWSD